VSSIDLTQLSIQELNELQRRAAEEKESRKSAAIEEIRKMIVTEAELAGLSVNEIVSFWIDQIPGKKKHASKNKDVVYMYQDPNDQNNKWSGKGRSPAWFAEAINRGVTKDQMLISK
jgi:DNA-binding protein H-NS